MIKFMAVLLPAPVRPSNATISDVPTVNDRSCTATELPNRFVTLTRRFPRVRSRPHVSLRPGASREPAFLYRG